LNADDRPLANRDNQGNWQLELEKRPSKRPSVESAIMPRRKELAPAANATVLENLIFNVLVIIKLAFLLR
jgi:hypothetical protein